MFATGAAPVVPPALGALPAGCHVLRTSKDADGILAAVAGARRAVVLGGGVLGVETACALRDRGVATTIVHDGEALLESSIGRTAGRRLTRAVRQLGIEVLLNAEAGPVESRDGRFRALNLRRGQAVHGDLLVVAGGIRPRSELATAAGLRIGTTEGVAVDRTLTCSDDPRIHAIGDCAEVDGITTGTVAPAWEQAEVLAARLAGKDVVYEPGPEVLRLTAGGLDVLALGLPFGANEASSTSRSGRTSEVVELGDEGGWWVGGCGLLLRTGWCGGLFVWGRLRWLLSWFCWRIGGRRLTARGLLGERVTAVPAMRERAVCRCNGVTRSVIRRAWEAGADSVAGIAERTRATTGCGSCTGAVGNLLDRLRQGETEPVPTRRATMTELKQARHLVVVGGGMVAHRLVEALRARDTGTTWRVTVLAEEPRLPYDRVALTTYFSGRDPQELSLGDAELWDDPAVTLRKGVAVLSVDPASRTVETSRGELIGYDELVLATGSSAVRPAGQGQRRPGLLRLPHGRRRGRPARVRRTAAGRGPVRQRRGRRRRSARPGGGGRAAGPRRRDHGGRVRAATDAVAGRRRWRQRARPADPRPRRRGAARPVR